MVRAGYTSIYHNVSEQRICSNRIRRSQEIRRNMFLGMITVFLVILLAITLSSFLSNAKSSEEPTFYKYYTSIEVQSGDTLWSIAQNYKGEHYRNAQEYIREVMQMNALRNDKLVTGQHLIIPYYSAEFIQ